MAKEEVWPAEIPGGHIQSLGLRFPIPAVEHVRMTATQGSILAGFGMKHQEIFLLICSQEKLIALTESYGYSSMHYHLT